MYMYMIKQHGKLDIIAYKYFLKFMFPNLLSCTRGMADYLYIPLLPRGFQI